MEVLVFIRDGMDSDDILYTTSCVAPTQKGVSKEKKRAAQKRAANLVVECGEVLPFLYNYTKFVGFSQSL